MEQMDKKIARLEQSLREALVAEKFFETASGKLITELLTREITQNLNEISSDKYLKDHVGYVNANIELRVRKNLLTRLQALANPKTKASLTNKLEALTDGTE